MTAPSVSTSQANKYPSVAKLLAVVIVSAAVAALLIHSSRKEAPTNDTISALPARQLAAKPADQSKSSGTVDTPQASSTNAAPPVSAESLETLAATDPSQALAFALAEKDDALRDILLQAILRGWAHNAPDAAADWAWIHQDAIEQGHAFPAIFNGTQQSPETSLRLAQRLSTEHPEEAWSFGRYLITSLTQTGNFAQAADFAATTPPDHRVDLLNAAYNPWGSQQPEKALQSAIALEDPLRQNAAFHAAIDGWSQTNPQSLTEAAYTFPEGNDRTVALVTGLRSWIEKDPASAETWIKAHKLTAEESSRALEE